MNCEFHKDRESVSKCKICGKELCEECDKINQKYSACPSCAKNAVARYYQNFKRGFMFNILSIICSVAFVVMYIISLVQKKLSLSYIIIGAVIIALLGSVSIVMFCYSLKKMKEYKLQIKLAEPKEEKNS